MDQELKLDLPPPTSWLVISNSTIILSSILLLLISLMTYHRIKQWRIAASKHHPPSPTLLPIIGHMHHMKEYDDNPWLGFCALREKLGDIYSLRMGIRKIVVVSSMDLIREVLIEKGQCFADRPDFARYHTIFDGDRENALALCDWSRTQRMRRVVATLVVLPRFSTHLFRQLNYCIKYDMKDFLSYQKKNLTTSQFIAKPELLFLCGNIFANYLCTRRFEYGHEEFAKTVWGYDYIFWDINHSYVFDFMPWVTKLGFQNNYFKELSDVCLSVRHHMEDNVITPRLHRYMEDHGLNKDTKDAERQSYKPSRDMSKADEDSENTIRSDLRDMRGKDFLDVSLEHHFKEQELYPWHVAVFEVLDLIGGSSAVGNLLLRLLGFLALNPQYQDLIHKEALLAIQKQAKRESEEDYIADKVDEDVDCDEDADGIPIINLMHRRDMPLMDAAIQETLRLASSPIIPHVANRDTRLAEYDIDKDTMVLFNTFHLNFSEENWMNPRDFDPRRFLIRADAVETHDHRINENNNGIQYMSPEDDGSVRWLVRKPKNFLPFSVGRRACLGYKLTKSVTFSSAANIILRYRLTLASVEEEVRAREQLIPKGGLGLPIDETCFKVMMTPRKQDLFKCEE